MYIEIFLLLLKKSFILFSGSVWLSSVCYLAKGEQGRGRNGN